MTLRVGGVYDSSTINFLREHKVTNFKFDFRPTSFNFIPVSFAEDIFKKNINSNESLSLCFSDDSELTISEVLKKVKGKLSVSSLYLEFYNALKDPNFYDSFNIDYCLHIESSFDIEKIDHYKNLKTICIDYQVIEQLFNFKRLSDFFNRLITRKKKEQSLELLIDWKQDLDPVILQYCQFNQASVDINSKVEKSYRNINKEELSLNLSYTLSSIGEIFENTIN